MGDALVEVVSEVSSGDGELLSGDGRAWRAMLCVAGGDGSAEGRRQGGQWPEGEIRAGEGDERESGIVAVEEGVFGGSWQGPEERLKRRSDGMMDPYPLVTKGLCPSHPHHQSPRRIHIPRERRQIHRTRLIPYSLPSRAYRRDHPSSQLQFSFFLFPLTHCVPPRPDLSRSPPTPHLACDHLHRNGPALE